MNEPLLGLADSGKLPDKVYAGVVEAILRGDYRADGKLPTETELAARFNVSRPTVREALSRLRSDGIVESRRGAGSYVVKLPATVPAQLTPIESVADIERYYAFRQCVEAGAAAAAAEQRDASDLEAIRAAYDALHAALDAGGPDVEEDVRFHLAVARASHNQFFVATLETSVGPIRQVMELARNLADQKSRDRRREVQREHQAIVDAIARRSPQDAAEAMRVHVFNARRRIFEGAQVRA